MILLNLASFQEIIFYTAFTTICLYSVTVFPEIYFSPLELENIKAQRKTDNEIFICKISTKKKKNVSSKLYQMKIQRLEGKKSVRQDKADYFGIISFFSEK